MDSVQAEVLAQARRDASRTRAAYLLNVAEGILTVEDVILAYPGEPALGRVALVQLLAAQPGVSRAAAERMVARFRRFAKRRFVDAGRGRTRNLRKVPERPTVSFIRHSQSKKLLPLFWEAVSPIDIPPWEGFPYRGAPWENGA